MTALVLRWRKGPPPVAVRWRGPDAAMTITMADAGPAPVAAVIGPPGPAGPVGGLVTCPAGEAIGGQRAVTIGPDGKAYRASPAGPGALAVFGLTAGAALAGAPVTIQCAGPMTEPSWTWTPGPVWLGPDGVPTQVLPLSGALVEIGTAGGATTLNIMPRVVARL